MKKEQNRWSQMAFHAILCLVPAFPLAAHAQRNVPFLQLGSPRLYADWRFDYESIDEARRIQSLNSSRYESQEGLIFEEQGSLYHPELMVFRGRARIAWLQGRSSGGSLGERLVQRGRLDVYRFGADFLRSKKLNFRFTSGRTKNRIRGTRIVSREDVQNDLTFSSSLRNSLLPLAFQWKRLSNDRGGLTNQKDLRYITTLQASRTKGNRSLRLSFTRTRFEIPVRGVRTGTKRFDANLARTPRGGLKLRSGLNWLRQDFGSHFESFRTYASALRPLGENLLVGTDMAMRRTTYTNNQNDTWDVGLTAEHHLYKSVTTTMRRQWSRSDIDGGNLLTNTSQLGLTYRKSNPIGVAIYHMNFERLSQNNQLESAAHFVAEETLTFPLEDFVLLANPDVLVETLVVTDSSGTETFSEDLDYTVEMRGRFVAILRTFDGRIEPGSTIRVSYGYSGGTQGVGGRETIRHEFTLRMPYGFVARALRSRTYPFKNASAFTLGTVRGDRERYGIAWMAPFARISWNREKALQDELFTLDERWLLSTNTRWRRLGPLSASLAFGTSQVGVRSDKINSTDFQLALARSLRRKLEMQLRSSVGRRDDREGARRYRSVELNLGWQYRANRVELEGTLRHDEAPAIGKRDDQILQVFVKRTLR